MTTTVEELLLGYVSAGVGVFPCHSARDGACSCRNPECKSIGKHPLTKHGHLEATTDAEQVRRWLAQFPWCNWAVRPPENVVVLDIDPRHNGDRNLADLEARHGALPPTLTARTGGGGEHRWFTYTGPRRAHLCEGVDLKFHSGFLIAPPSIHESGRSYEWISQRPAVWLPTWAKKILDPPFVRPTYNGAGNIDSLVKFVEQGNEGERNRRLYWAACRAIEGGHDPAVLIDAAVSVGTEYAEAVNTIRSAFRAPSRSGAA